jgi:Sulfotransferase family
MSSNFNAFSFQPIVIIGAPRSGTNMLRDALTSFSGVATWPCDEINAIWRHNNTRFPSDELQPAQATPRVRRFVRRAFGRLARRTQAQWIVEKTCANSLRVDFLRAILPEAKFVFLVRDGRDSVASAMKCWRAGFDLGYTLRKARYVPLSDAPGLALRFIANRVHGLSSSDRSLRSWGPRFDGMQEMIRKRSLAEICAEQWRRCVTHSATSLAAGADRVCYVRYESFVRNPHSGLQQVADFAGIHVTGERLRSIASAISPRSVGKWRTELDADTLSRIEPMIRQTTKSIESWNSSQGIDIIVSSAA